MTFNKCDGNATFKLISCHCGNTGTGTARKQSKKKKECEGSEKWRLKKQTNKKKLWLLKIAKNECEF